MKVIDPQCAVLTTAEVHHFLKNNPPRNPDKKIGAYKPVVLKNHVQIRKDVDHYLRTTTPYILKYPAPETWVSTLTTKLKRYGLTKPEVLALVNLGLGLDRGSLDATVQTNGDGTELDTDVAHGDVEMGNGDGHQNGDDEDDGGGDEEEEEEEGGQDGGDQLDGDVALEDVNENEPAEADGELEVEDDGEGEGESNYDRQILSLIIDEIDTRFPGDEGEEKLKAILAVVKECIHLEAPNGITPSEKGKENKED